MDKEKALIFDSGTLITLSMNGLLYILEKLKKSFPGKFLITNAVKYETLDRPIKVPRFELEALRIKNLIGKKILEFPESLGIDQSTLKEETIRLMEIANNSIEAKGKRIKIISEAETSCLALSKELTKRKITNIIAIDERTTRILSEKPENLEKIMSKKLHTRVHYSKKSLQDFKEFRFIRSTELVYVAYKKGYLEIKDPKALEAVLYATKFKGSSVSFDEINELKRL